MFIKVKSRFSGKYVILLFLTLLIFTKTFAAEYTVPRAAYSVYAEDLDLDGDKDIVVGHNYNSQTEWSGVSILENNGYGEFTLIDSIFLYGWQPDVQIKNLNLNENPEIIAKHEDSQEENEYIAIINDFNFYDISYFPLNTYEGVGNLANGDIDNDNDIDIIVASNNGQFWGVLYNNGTGQFSSPEYHYVTGYYPVDIACGNLNEDNRNDIAICAQKTEVYFSYETGFQCLTLEENNFKNEINISDMDYDGDNDIVVLVDLLMMGYTGITIYENIGNDNFYQNDEILFQPALGHFEISDLNNDSFPDIVCTGYDDGIYILYNEGNFNLSEPQYFYVANFGEFSRRSFCADVDGNGFNDIITIRYLHAILPANLNILFNDGNGNFVEEPQVGISNEVLKITNCKLSNYPNPFNPSITIRYGLPEQSDVVLQVYNIKGQLVKTLENTIQPAGYHEVTWYGKDENGKTVSNGIYFYKLSTDKFTSMKRMLLLK